MTFKRFRQLRVDQVVRDANAEVNLQVSDIIYPYFVIEGASKKEAIPSLKDVYRFSIDALLVDVEEIVALGISKILLFGVVDDAVKDELATAAYSSDNLVVRAIKAIKVRFPDLMIFTDVCVCAYTNHGHCGVLIGNEIDNDKTLPLLAKMALSHALAGADVVAPSAMMDGQVLAIKNLLAESDLYRTKILGYSAKYSSNFYGPFRDAAQSSPSFGDRRSYQMDYRTLNQGVDEIEADVLEGANWVMVKPALNYLDIIYRGKQQFPAVPMVAYHVSGEYMMVVAAAEKGYLSLQPAMIESLTAIKRAGANYIITYYGKELAKFLAS